MLTVAPVTALVCLIILLFFKSSVYFGPVQKIAGVLQPFLYGAVIAYLIHPVCRFFERHISRLLDHLTGKKVPGAVRMVSIILSLVLLFVVVFLLLITVLPQIVSSLSGIIKELPGAIERFQNWITNLDNGEMSHEVVTGIQDAVATITERLEHFLQTDLVPYLQAMVSNVTSSFMNLLSVLKNFGLGCIVSAYILGSWEKIGRAHV